MGCTACQAADVRRHVVSRRTGHVIEECRRCGARALGEHERPPDEEFYDWDRASYEAYVEVTRQDLVDRSHHETLRTLRRLSPRVDRPRLFDVGAGAGAFLSTAREAGFAPAGNELAPGAVELAKERYDIDLLLGDLSDLEVDDRYEAVTMWCVLAHVAEPDKLLLQVHDLLTPGGVLFLQTPRWCSMDRVALGCHDLSGGRLTHLTDRRLGGHHRVLHTERSIRANLERLGYDVIEVRPRVRFSLTTDFYLHWLHLKPSVRRQLVRGIDGILDREWCVRNVLDVYARKR